MPSLRGSSRRPATNGQRFSRAPDACVAPVLSFTEAPDHPHNRARETFVETNGFYKTGAGPAASSRSRTQPSGLLEVDPLESLATFGIGPCPQRRAAARPACWTRAEEAMAQNKDVIRPTDEEAIGLSKLLMRVSPVWCGLAVLDPGNGERHRPSRVAGRPRIVTGRPIILVSSLSGHTPGTARRSALFACSLGGARQGRSAGPITAHHLGLQGPPHRTADGSTRPRFASVPVPPPQGKALCRFRRTSPYFLLDPQSASLNGRLRQGLSPDARRSPVGTVQWPRRLAAGEAGAVAHNECRPWPTLSPSYCAPFTVRRRPDPGPLTGIDPDGLDLALGDKILRIGFPAPLKDAGRDAAKRSWRWLRNAGKRSENNSWWPIQDRKRR